MMRLGRELLESFSKCPSFPGTPSMRGPSLVRSPHLPLDGCCTEGTERKKQNRPSLHTIVLVHRTTVLEKSADRREEDGAGAGTGCWTRGRNGRRSRNGGAPAACGCGRDCGCDRDRAYGCVRDRDRGRDRCRNARCHWTVSGRCTEVAVGVHDSVVAIRFEPCWSEFSHFGPLGNDGRYRAYAACAAVAFFRRSREGCSCSFLGHPAHPGVLVPIRADVPRLRAYAARIPPVRDGPWQRRL